MPNTIILENGTGAIVKGKPVVFSKLGEGLHRLLDELWRLFSALCRGHDPSDLRRVVEDIHNPASPTTLRDDLSSLSDRYSPVSNPTSRTPLMEFTTWLIDRLFSSSAEQSEGSLFLRDSISGEAHFKNSGIHAWFVDFDSFILVRNLSVHCI